MRGLPTIDRRALKEDPVAAIARIAGEHRVDRLVLGVPYTMAGEEGPQAAAVRAFQARLEEALAVPVEEWDERLTTEAARRRLAEMGYDERQTRARIDQLSAVLMLEGWLRRKAGAVEESAEPNAASGTQNPPGPARDSRSPARGLPATLFLALALAVIGGLWWASSAPSGEPAPVQLVVEPGTPVRRLARDLEAVGVVRSALLLEVWLRLRGEAQRIQAGTYQFSRDQSLFAVADQLVGGETVLAAVTVPEGLRLEQTAGVVARTLAIDSAAFTALAADSALADSLLPDALVRAEPKTLEGYLFPETYYVDPAVAPRGLAGLMVSHFWEAFGPPWRARADSLGKSIHEIVTLASIVEEEAKVPDERKTIAGVFWNRLRRGMPLEADPTIQYALGGHRARVLYRDLGIDSPYNTYRYPGLPPGPIASPGRAALEATLYPDSVPWLYFFATGEGGRHAFSETYQDHLRKRRQLGR